MEIMDLITIPQRQLQNSFQEHEKTELSIYEFFGTKICELSEKDFKAKMNNNFVLLQSVFKDISKEFFQTLVMMLNEDEKTIEWFDDAVRFVIKNNTFTPKIADFYKFDRRGIITDYFQIYCWCDPANYRNYKGRRQCEFEKYKTPGGEIVYWDTKFGKPPKMFELIKRL